MTLSPKVTPASQYLDLQNGTVNRGTFVDEDLYRLEQERIFARAWLVRGHVSQNHEAG